jgi:hypothetical protein
MLKLKFMQSCCAKFILKAFFFQVAASCPIDRIPFTLIHVREGGGEEEGRVEKVVARREEQQEVLEEEPEIQCEVCTRGDREHLLLLCDGCDLGIV